MSRKIPAAIGTALDGLARRRRWKSIRPPRPRFALRVHDSPSASDEAAARARVARIRPEHHGGPGVGTGFNVVLGELIADGPNEIRNELSGRTTGL